MRRAAARIRADAADADSCGVIVRAEAHATEHSKIRDMAMRKDRFADFSRREGSTEHNPFKKLL